jgi:hypothetical protein
VKTEVDKILIEAKATKKAASGFPKIVVAKKFAVNSDINVKAIPIVSSNDILEIITFRKFFSLFAALH